ncbi:hypothetical protein Kpol_1020p19 [Vanderwaltozyma polyspora DSM 70294]|uniref:Uncharacterized protein n=1 Tax=Vanderwaltozyma polyspora (strain ATCC 22028 / DSM 70294 / BCRC 21397 / CBS 2163 / NBRC 10782 / NRRL Y-8283 / UCD 57-17) TaxID=436907 RepID=A7TLD0_VANPO|nr:uncharacterized protein Kpol_1020p19 [Vanderwaltozyma polyspora DSM 70294]EDO16911.1 hypothetical protein Kpol_1020p19 [Vanderwaltozyma polyspora DSM 70294]
MAIESFDFAAFKKQLTTDLQSLSSESKRKSTDVKHASDKSIEILKTVTNINDLTRHPDFVVPFILACSSGNAKLTSISMQCIQVISTVQCIPSTRISEILDAFINATHLAVEIQLKVMQILPIFFNTYSKLIYGDLCSKLLKCCSNLLQLSTKYPMVAGTASATLQQLIDEIFDRLSYTWEDNEETKPIYDNNIFKVAISDSEKINTNAYHYDVNNLLAALCFTLDSSKKMDSNPVASDITPILNVSDIPIDYALEILETILKNNKELFFKYTDLSYILRIKAVPLLLRNISSSNQFTTVVRSYRCVRALLQCEFIPVMELEMEVVLSLLIHVISKDSDLPVWKKALSLELFLDISKNFNFLQDIFISYDKFPDRKHILENLLKELNNLINSEDLVSYLQESTIIEITDSPLISNELSMIKTPYIQTFDKINVNSINLTYFIWIILGISSYISEGLSLKAQDVIREGTNTDSGDYKNLEAMFNGIFIYLFDIHKKFLYSTSLDSHLFHSAVRSFQKISHVSGVLSNDEKLTKCLNLFSLGIVQNAKRPSKDAPKDDNNDQLTRQTSTVLNVLSETLMGTSESEKTNEERTSKKVLHPRKMSKKHVVLLRALLSLSISLGSNFNSVCWRYVLVTWQWVSYFIYGPSSEFMENYYVQDVPSAPALSKNSISSIESSIENLLTNSTLYNAGSFEMLLRSLIECSHKSLSMPKFEDNICQYPVSESGEIEYCLYNKSFFVTELGEFSMHNSSQFYMNPDGENNWFLIYDYLVELIGNRDISNTLLRLYATRVYTDIILKTTNSVDEIKDADKRKVAFGSLEVLFSKSFTILINKLRSLDMGKEQIYHGVADTESKILLQLLFTLKEVLNEFGDSLDKSWPTVFEVINSPFQWVVNDDLLVATEAEDDSSLVTGLVLKHKEMVEVSYDVFKLISDDFLQTLPLDTIKDVIDTLRNFVSQSRNLNISFSSISQFWLVGDYLRIHHKIENIESSDVEKFSTLIQEKGLIEVVNSTDSSRSQFEISSALWLYLLKKLVECTTDSRNEIKSGSIQTFFRIISSHSNYLPDWDLIFLEVLNPLLTANMNENEMHTSVEFLNNVLQGIINLYPIHFVDFSSSPNRVPQWSTLLDYFQRILVSDSTEASHAAIVNFQKLLKELVNIKDIPSEILKKLYEIWCGYSIIYGDISGGNTFHQVSGYDCIDEHIKGFPYLFELMKLYNQVTVEFVEKALSLFNSAVRYPLLPEHTKDNKKPSSLQGGIMKSLSTFKCLEDPELEKLLLLQLGAIATLPFETREKIEKKLLPKLSANSRSRIPTFEAISYNASVELNDRLYIIVDKKPEIVRSDFITKVMRNLGEIIERKSLIDVSAEKNKPMWLLVSGCLRTLSVELFKSTEMNKEPNQFIDTVCDIYTKVTVAPLHKLDPQIDEETQDVDKEEYCKYRDILLSVDVMKFIGKEQLEFLVSTVWTNSFLYHLDEIEDVLIKSGNNLYEVSEKLSEFQFSDIAGSTIESPLLSKYKCAIECLNDLVKFITLQGEEYKTLRTVAAPYLVSRIAFALRRHISDQSLVGRAPISKIRKLELETLLRGLRDILESLLSDTITSNETVVKNVKLLYPLILRTIPISHKVPDLQEVVLDLSLGFTKLTSK